MATLKKAKADTKKKVKEKELPMELEFVVDETTKFVARVGEFQEKWRLDVRKHITTTKYTGFTKDGINVTADKVEDLLVMINTLHDTIKAKGLDKVEGE